MTKTTTQKSSLQAKTKGNTLKKPLLIGSVALVVVAVAACSWYFLRKRKNKTEDFGTTTASRNRKPSSGFGCKNSSYPLQYGSCHTDVGILQRYLKVKHNAHLGSYGKNHDGIDNKFGKITQNAVRKHLHQEVFTKTNIALFAAALKIKTS